MISHSALPRPRPTVEPRTSALRGCPRPHSKRTAVVPSAVPPSSATAANALEKLQRYSVVLPVEGINKAQTGAAASSTAVVNFAVLQELVANASMIEYVNAIERAVSFTKQNGGTTNEALDAALVNVGMKLKECVTGRIVVEVDPRLAHDTDGMVQRARSLVKSFESQGCGRDKLLLQLPASWEGLQAVAKLEKEGIQCEVTRVFSFPQGVQAIKAGASVVLTDIRRIDTWYDKYPGVIRDPSAPRQDVGVMVPSQSSVGIRVATAIYNYAQQQGGRTKIVVGGIRTPEEAITLSGIDYMLLTDSVKAALAATETLQGYNDGLSAAVSVDDTDDIPALTPESGAKWKFKPSEVMDLSKEAFDAELGMAGADLLAASLQDGIESTDRIAKFVDNYAVAQV